MAAQHDLPGNDAAGRRSAAGNREGQKLRASGVPCLCPLCGTAGEAINDRETQRQRYAASRTRPLIAKGVEPAERERIIAAEIDAGAAEPATPAARQRIEPHDRRHGIRVGRWLEEIPTLLRQMTPPQTRIREIGATS